MVLHRIFIISFILPTLLAHTQPNWEWDPADRDAWKTDGSDVMPTDQPPTRAEDFQHCARAALPSVVNLAPLQSTWFHRTGNWQDKMGAERVSWEQNRVRIDYNNLDYSVNSKPWFHAHVLRNEALELRHMRIALPPPLKEHRATTTVVFIDCMGTPMYVSREFKNREFEIYNHVGKLVATGHPSQMVEGQIYFNDPKGIAFAIAGSPSIAEVNSGKKEYIPQWHLYDFDHWQIWFMEGYNSLTYLKEPDYRWVITAIVQEHAILQTLDTSPGSGMPFQYILFLLLIAATCIGVVSLCAVSFRAIFFLVYPPKIVKRGMNGNPFMVEDIGGAPYGSMKVQRKAVRQSSDDEENGEKEKD